MKVENITTEKIVEMLNNPLVDISIRNSNNIANVKKEDGKYMIHVNDNLDDQLIMYFIFHELSHVLMKDFDKDFRANFFLEMEDVDIPALRAYLDKKFDPEIIANSKLFEKKMENKEFSEMIEKARGSK